MSNLQILSALAAIPAALLWFLSAVVKTPQSFSVHVVRPDSPPLGGNPLSGEYVGQAYSNDLVNLANALRRQSRLSGWAALCASISAILQAVSILAS